jgi:hypothetical protein
MYDKQCSQAIAPLHCTLVAVQDSEQKYPHLDNIDQSL